MRKKLLVIVMMLAMVFAITACGKKSEGSLMFDVPAGFEYNTEVRCYLGPNYPDELANINYYSYENDGTFGVLTETSIESAMEESLSESFLEDIDITITEWEKTKVDGYKAFVYSYEFESGGIGYEQMQVAINGKDYIHYVTFTDYAGTSYKDEFYTCIKNMRFE